jgi:hypothetical protein
MVFRRDSSVGRTKIFWRGYIIYEVELSINNNLKNVTFNIIRSALQNFISYNLS